MKKASALLIILFLFSCAPSKIVPIKGKYPPTPIVANSPKTFDQAWDIIIDYFAQNGIPIKIIDRSSGLIVSEQTKLTWSFEKKDGSLFLPTASVVLEKILKPSSENWFSPQEVTGEWNVRVKKAPDGTVSINVNLYNIKALYERYYYSYVTHTAVEPILTKGTTTGNFETAMENVLK
jgi:hypothetical protein